MSEAKLYFHPLYFIFHDCWSFRTWRWVDTWGGGFWEVATHDQHRGHVHFFMPRHDLRGERPYQAYSGNQVYNFKLNETWSPNSEDPNQTLNVKIVGSPKWYFYVKEFWRRIYLQEWDSSDNVASDPFTNKRGVKWDASHSFHTYGPFREGKDNFFYWANTPRTLPVEYWLDEKKKIRTHYVRNEPDSEMNQKWDVSNEGFEADSPWQIPKDSICGNNANGHGIDNDPESFQARRVGYPDSNYIYPTIEYQTVVHRNWQRLPGEIHRQDGDGFEIAVSLPYKNEEGIIQSPFSNDEGVVSPVGTYHHGFDVTNPDKVLKYAPTNNVDDRTWSNGPPVIYNKNDYLIPTGMLGQRVEFTVPPHMRGKEDGMWVEQCLGGIVLARAEVTIQDNFGGVSTVYVTNTQFIVQDNFEGKDQDAPAT